MCVLTNVLFKVPAFNSLYSIFSLKEEWRSWDRSLIETEIILESKLSQVTQYEESYGTERSALSDTLEKFRSRLDELQVERLVDSGSSGDEIDPAVAASLLKKCQVSIKWQKFFSVKVYFLKR